MKKYLLTIAVLALALGFIPSKVRAEDSDSSGWKVTTIRWIQEHQDQLSDSDKNVILVGKLVSQDGNDYVLDDGTGTIQISCADAMPVGKKIEARGTLERAYLGVGELELNVSSWRPNE